jgi:nitroreductase
MITDLDTVLTTTRAVRRRLDYGRPVDRDLIHECLALAIHAPNGGNRQDWRFVVIDDRGVLAKIAEYYHQASSAWLAADSSGDQATRSAVKLLADRMHEVPALLVGCLAGRLPADVPAAKRSSFFGSIYPALWSFMLAARSRGLGTALLTSQLSYEREIAEVLGIPYETTTQAAMVAVGHLTGSGMSPARRRPVDEVLSWNRWSEERPR